MVVLVAVVTIQNPAGSYKQPFCRDVIMLQLW
jgi:hypothetical protein